MAGWWSSEARAGAWKRRSCSEEEAEMRLGDRFATARHGALKAGICPVLLLDDFYTEHWDFGTLCREFGCKTCVAEPEDMGCPVSDEVTVDSLTVEEGCEIPF